MKSIRIEPEDLAHILWQIERIAKELKSLSTQLQELKQFIEESYD